jgi:hypothetical protein
MKRLRQKQHERATTTPPPSPPYHYSENYFLNMKRMQQEQQHERVTTTTPPASPPNHYGEKCSASSCSIWDKSNFEGLSTPPPPPPPPAPDQERIIRQQLQKVARESFPGIRQTHRIRKRKQKCYVQMEFLFHNKVLQPDMIDIHRVSSSGDKNALLIEMKKEMYFPLELDMTDMKWKYENGSLLVNIPIT